MNFSLEQLRTFVVASQAGSFSAAARELKKAQSVVSTAIANLELDLGVNLFDRSSRMPRLTRNGESLLAKAELILDNCGRLTAAAEQLQSGIESQITLAVEPMAMTQALAEQLRAFSAQYPLVQIEILNAGVGDVLQLLQEARAQIALLLQTPELEFGFEFFGLGSLDMLCIAASHHPLAIKKRVGWEDLKGHLQILLSGRYAKKYHSWKISDAIWTTESAISAMQLVSSGVGWTALPSAMVLELIKTGTLTKLELDFEVEPWRQGMDIAWSTQHPMGPASRVLLDLLKKIKL